MAVARNPNANANANAAAAETERRRRRRKQKKNKHSRDYSSRKENSDSQKDLQLGEVEYVPEKAEFDVEFTKVFQKFNFLYNEENDKKDESASSPHTALADSDSEEDEQQKEKEISISNKKKKLERRMKIAELKQICARSDLVEVWDANSADPKLLVYLNSYRNTVAVPPHWSQKRKFLNGKRGIQKQPFQLPDFIAATGIDKIRQAYIEKEDSNKLKQKQRERMQPKMGKLEIDYQLLHDAFFKHQTKPKLTYLGDLYYEGKEFEVKLPQMKPGTLSHELKEALGMTDGICAPPPPWLINMQRYGLPPSYPSIKIPGLHAPIPTGGKFGYGHGEWGKPPVDEYVFGIVQQEEPNYEEKLVDMTKHWGEFDDEEEEEEEEKEEEEEVMVEEELEDGIESVDRLSSTPTGVDYVIDLRKQQRKEPEPKHDRPLYQVLEEKEEMTARGSLLGPGHTYVINTGAKRVRSQKSNEVDVTLAPEDLDAMENVLQVRYEEAREEEKLRTQKEDFSDMVAENANKRKRKMQDKEKQQSKKRDFKF